MFRNILALAAIFILCFTASPALAQKNALGYEILGLGAHPEVGQPMDNTQAEFAQTNGYTSSTEEISGQNLAAEQTRARAEKMYNLHGKIGTGKQPASKALIISFGNDDTAGLQNAFIEEDNIWSAGENYATPSYMDYNSDATYDPEIRGVSQVQSAAMERKPSMRTPW